MEKPTNQKETVGLNVELSPELHRRVKVGAAIKDKSIKAAVIEVLEKAFPPLPDQKDA